jgi:HEPN domain-containing protein
MNELTKEWLARANDDLETIKEIIDNPELTNIAAFHAQQAIEKSLKAVIEEFKIGFIKIHNLEKLFALTNNYLQIEINLELVKKLDALYIDSRYPSEFGILPYGKPTVEDATEFSEFAKRVVSGISNFLMK